MLKKLDRNLQYDRKENVLDAVQSDIKIISAKNNPYPAPTRIIFYSKNQYLMRGDDVKQGKRCQQGTSSTIMS